MRPAWQANDKSLCVVRAAIATDQLELFSGLKARTASERCRVAREAEQQLAAKFKQSDEAFEELEHVSLSSAMRPLPSNAFELSCKEVK